MGAMKASLAALSMALAGALALAACGPPAALGGSGGSGAGDAGADAGMLTVSCDDTSSMGGTTAHQCTLFTGTAMGLAALQAQESCSSEGGTLGSSCATTGTLGSCTASSMGVMWVIHYYSGETAADDQSYCTSIGGTWSAD